MDLCVQAALHERSNTQTIEEVFFLSEYWHHKWDFLLDLYLHVSSQGHTDILPILKPLCPPESWCDFLLDLYSRVKDYESQTGRSVLPALQPVFQSPTVWSIDLSERKVSLLLEVMKLQPEKKPVELRGCSDEESEVKIFLQCLPYISQLRFMFPFF